MCAAVLSVTNKIVVACVHTVYDVIGASDID